MIYDFQFKDYLKDVDGMPVECINSFYVDASNQVEAMQKGCQKLRRMFRTLPDHLETVHGLEVKELS